MTRTNPSARTISRPLYRIAPRVLGAAALALLVSACANQIDAGVSREAGSPGFLWGLWHGFIFPWAWIGSLFSDDIAVYAVPNKGAWYDFGFFLGITVLGGGSFFGSKKARD
ncbi:MAG: hypothetical protein QNI87_06715 [Erythrobacter sp.]|uniref:hypothetical protein n=1 Tax=Erythrobacter sp. TaxID=1042 RepID=UPI0026239722|nr:hypothetical protein [Erythrobacter sp.]MDJ0978209.1 hypothetical protein [Erythrobacter sp.]